jgi:hypothetical protein
VAQSNSQPPSAGWWLKALGVAVLCVVSGIIGSALTRNFGTSSYSISYADFVSIMLTAVSLLMTVLAIFLGVFGFIGWNAIQGRVHQRTEEFLNEGFKEGRPLYQMLETRATEIIYEGIIPVVGDDDEENKEEGEE